MPHDFDLVRHSPAAVQRPSDFHTVWHQHDIVRAYPGVGPAECVYFVGFGVPMHGVVHQQRLHNHFGQSVPVPRQTLRLPILMHPHLGGTNRRANFFARDYKLSASFGGKYSRHFGQGSSWVRAGASPTHFVLNVRCVADVYAGGYFDRY